MLQISEKITLPGSVAKGSAKKLRLTNLTQLTVDTSLYMSLAQRAHDPEVLRILLSIGPTETMHFQTWQDKAGNATPVTAFDPINKSTVTFTDLHANTEEHLQANLIMPEPTPFLDKTLPICSIICPTQTTGAAMGAAKALVADGLFIGQTMEFTHLLLDLARMQIKPRAKSERASQHTSWPR